MSEMKKRILIAGHPDLTQNYQAALLSTGMEYEIALSIHDINSFDGLLLPGGGDIDPIYFHQPNLGSKNIDSSLDEKQFRILDAFVTAKKGILGICKGIQLINIYFGGNIIQDLKTAKTHAYHDTDRIHVTHSVEHTFIHHLYGNHIFTNSAHHQGCGVLGHHLLPSQYAFDGVLEALYHTSLPIIGVQWHPERMAFQFSRLDTVDGSLVFLYFKSLL